MARRGRPPVRVRPSLLLLLAASLSLVVLASATGAGNSSSASEPASPDACADLARQFVAARGAHPQPGGDPAKLLYFLHIPRTAGRTYHFCFLKQAHPPSRRCAKLYDRLRLDARVQEGCGLLSSHDDWSISEQLPADAVFLTQLRDPVGRVLSSYEFAHEVAALDAIDQKAPPAANATKVDTRNVWPWSQLVPLLEQALRARFPAAKRAAEARAAQTGERRVLDPYANDVTLPLTDFLRHPEVADHVSNGATLQVLGLTSYSRWPEAAALRACLPASPVAQQALLRLALARLESFAHVGLFDRLEDSMASLAATLGIDFEGPAWASKQPPGGRAAQASGSSSSGSSSSDDAARSSFPLWRAYHRCTDKARQKQARRHARAFRSLDLPGTERLQFSAAARQQIDGSVLQLVREQNAMDVALYERGRQLLEARIAEHKAAGRWRTLRPKSEADLEGMARHEAAEQRLRRRRRAAAADADEGLISSTSGSADDHSEL